MWHLSLPMKIALFATYYLPFSFDHTYELNTVQSYLQTAVDLNIIRQVLILASVENSQIEACS